MTGKRIVVASWLTLGVFALIGILDVLGVSALDTAVGVYSLALFFASLVIWIYAFGKVLVRNTQGDDIAVASWVFLQGSAPKDVRRHLLGATLASCILGFGMGFANPLGALVPMFQLGLAALWGARHGTYPERTLPPATTRGVRR